MTGLMLVIAETCDEEPQANNEKQSGKDMMGSDATLAHHRDEVGLLGDEHHNATEEEIEQRVTDNIHRQRQQALLATIINICHRSNIWSNSTRMYHNYQTHEKGTYQFYHNFNVWSQ